MHGTTRNQSTQPGVLQTKASRQPQRSPLQLEGGTETLPQGPKSRPFCKVPLGGRWRVLLRGVWVLMKEGKGQRNKSWDVGVEFCEVPKCPWTGSPDTYLKAAKYSASPMGGSRPPVKAMLTLKPTPGPVPTCGEERSTCQTLAGLAPVASQQSCGCVPHNLRADSDDGTFSQNSGSHPGHLTCGCCGAALSLGPGGPATLG